MTSTIKRPKILTVAGTRPEVIKIAPVMRYFKARNDFDMRLCVTGQHREMLNQALEVFRLEPDFRMDIMKSRQDLNHITSSVLLGMRDVLGEFQPDLVLVQGDTSTTFAAALAAFYNKIPVAHVEAGLRTGDLYAPWPEEANRRLTTQIAAYHFPPTELNRKNLLAENIAAEKILVTGNTVIDALQTITKGFVENPGQSAQLRDFFREQIHKDFPSRRYVLITGHRRENFGAGFEEICVAIQTLARRKPDVDFIYPVHLNPNVQKPVQTILSGLPNVFLISPVDYLKFVYLLSNAYLVLTDSGGIQEEAPGLGKPVLVMRDVTERPEGIDAGTVRLVGSNSEKIVANLTELLDDETAYSKMSNAANPYGDGNASGRIFDFLKAHL